MTTGGCKTHATYEASLNHGTGSELVTDSLDESSWVLTSLNTLETQTSEDAIPLAFRSMQPHTPSSILSLSLSITYMHACWAVILIILLVT